MMHQETYYYDVMDSIHDQHFFSPFENSHEVFLDPFGSLASSESLRVSFADDFSMSFEEFELESSFGFEFEGLLEESVGSFPSQMSSPSSVEMSPMEQVLILPCEGFELENESSVSHLMRAYSEAMEKKQRELEQVTLRRIRERSSPLGKPLERVAFYLSQQVENENENEFDYLKQESLKSFDTALEAFHLIFPYTKFTHFTANSAILDSTPDDVETIHIVDFDVGDGLQLAQMIEAAAKKRKRLRVTSIRWEEKKKIDCDGPMRFGFEKTRRKLIEHARTNGVGIKMEEIRIEDFVNHVKKGMRNGAGNEYLAFNCVMGITRVRNRNLVKEFLRLAKELLVGSIGVNGIIVLANWGPSERLLESTSSSFGSFFDAHVEHYKAMLESMECGFPNHLAEARVGMECLFVAPHVSSREWHETWGETKGGRDFTGSGIGMGMEGWRLSSESVMEGNEMVKGDSCFGVRVGGMNGNEVALEWNETPLVRVSAWINHR